MIEYYDIHDGEDFPWFCKLHNCPAEMMCGDWRCPKCNEYIEDAWTEFEESQEEGSEFDPIGWTLFTSIYRENHLISGARGMMDEISRLRAQLTFVWMYRARRYLSYILVGLAGFDFGLGLALLLVRTR
jgi:hypothetical protein